MFKSKELDLVDSINFIEKFSETPKALLLGVFVLATLYYPYNLISKDTFWTSSLIFFSIIAFIIGWHYLRYKIPKNKKRLGILISIEASDSRIESKFNKHFIEELDINLKKNSIADSIDLYCCTGLKAKKYNAFLTSFKQFKEEIENRVSAKKIPKDIIDKKDKAWKKFLDKTSRPFFVWGNVYDEGKELLVNLNGMVFHGNTDFMTKQLIKRELNNIFPQRITIDDSNIKNGFLVSAKHFSIAIKHICGMSAVIAKKYDLACDLLMELLRELESSSALPTRFAYLKDFIKETLGFAFFKIAQIEQHTDLVASADYLEKSLFYDDKNFEALNLKSYLEFSKNKNLNGAIEFANKSSEYSGNDYVWAYNKAFLLMYKEEFKEALKLYKRIFGNSFLGEEGVVNDVLKFNKSIIVQESERIQSLFIMGYIISRKQRNLIYAYDYLVDFVKKAGKKEKFKILVDIAKKYIERAERIINKNK